MEKKRERVKHLRVPAGTPSWLAAIQTAPDTSPETEARVKALQLKRAQGLLR